MRQIGKLFRLVGALAAALALVAALVTSSTPLTVQPVMAAVDVAREQQELQVELAMLKERVQQARLESYQIRSAEREWHQESRRMLVSRSATAREEARLNFALGRLSGIVPERYRTMLVEIGDRFGVDPLLIAAVIRVESVWDPNLTGTHQDAGLMQILPGTGAWIAAHMGLDEYDLYDPETNVIMGTWYLKSLYHRYGSWERALAAYNGGPKAAPQGRSWPYTQWVLRIYEEEGG